MPRDTISSRAKAELLIKELQEQAPKHAMLLADFAESAAAAYLGAIALLEMGSVAEDLKWWGKAVVEQKKQPTRIQAWLDTPRKMETLAKAIAWTIKQDGKDYPAGE